MKPKAICLIHHAGIQGYPYLIDTARLLAQAGWQVDVLALADAPLPEYHFRDPRIHTHKFPRIVRGGGKVQRIARFSLYIPWAVTTACRRRYSAFIGFDQNGLIAASLSTIRSSRVSVVYYVPELHVSADQRSLMARIKKSIERFFSQRVEAIVVLNHRHVRILKRENSLKEDKKIFVVPNAPLAGNSSVLRSDHLQKLLAEHGIQDRRIIVLHMGTVSDLTRVRDIAQTVDRWPQECVLVIHGWGEPEYIKELQRLASQHIPPRIVISTVVLPYDEVDTLVCSADIGLALYDGGITNRYEMASGKLYSYMKAGLPAIASDFPTLREVVEGNGAGICVDGDDMATLVAAIHQLAGDPGLRQRYGRNARRAFLEKYAYERNFTSVLSLLDSLLTRGSSC